MHRTPPENSLPHTQPFRAVRALPALCAFILTAVLFFNEVVFQGRVFAARDHYLFFMPRRFFALEMLRDGTLPLWNPLNACGVPFLANVQSSVFYPLSALVYLLPFPAGYSVFVVAHYILAACCMYALMRHWKCSPTAAFIAGVVFAFGGYMQSINDNLAFVTSAAWMPLVVLCFSRALQERTRRWVVATSVLIGMQVLAGDASFCLVSTALCTGLYALCSPRRVAAAPAGTRAAVFMSVWLGGVLLAAVVLVPFFEFVRLSDRAAGLAMEESLRWSLHPLELLQLIHPYIFGTLVPDVRWFGQRWLDTVYIGIVPLCLSVFYLARCRCAHKAFLAAAAATGLFFALGAYNPVLFYAMDKVPALRLMQYPVKFFLLSAFALAAMSALGADMFLERMRRRAGIRGMLKPLLLPVCVLLAILLAAAVFRGRIFELFTRAYPDSAYFAPLRDSLFYGLYRGTFFAAVLFAGFAALAWFAVRFRHRPSLTVLLVAAVVCADLFFLGSPRDPWLAHQEVCRPSPVVTALQRDDSVYRIFSLSRIAGGMSYSHTPHLPFDRVYRVLRKSLPPNLHMYHGLASADEYSELLNVRYYELFGRVLLYLAGRLNDPADIHYSRKMFSMLNVKYVISPRRLPELGFECVHDGQVQIYRNRDVWPRAFVAARVIACEDDAEVLRSLHTGDFGPKTVFVSDAELGKLSMELRAVVADGLRKGDGNDVSIVRSAANRVDIRAATGNAGILVLADTWFPGWVVEVNGQERPLLRVNHTLRGVALEPGISRVAFVYRPRSFFAGLVISGAVLLVLLGILAAGRPRPAQVLA